MLAGTVNNRTRAQMCSHRHHTCRRKPYVSFMAQSHSCAYLCQLGDAWKKATLLFDGINLEYVLDVKRRGGFGL
jgi:hypothetical protein